MRPQISWIFATVLATTALATAPPAHAQQNWTRSWADRLYLTADLGVSGTINQPARDLYGVGGDGRLTLFGAVAPQLSIGAFAMAGALSKQGLPPGAVDHGIMDYAMFGASVRVYPFAGMWDSGHRGAGFYIGVSPGIAVANGQARLAYTASTGFNIPVGPIAIGPQFRFTHLIDTGSSSLQANDPFARNDILMWTGGLEITILDQTPTPEPEPAAYTPREPVAQAPQPAPPIAELPPEPAPEPEPEPQTQMPVVNPALTLDERVYFDFDHADLRGDARQELDQIVDHYRRYGDRYQHLIISGYADDRGTPEYNEALSAARALAVTNYLVQNGVPIEVIEIRAHGENDPLIANAQTPLAHQINRRVAFEVQWAPGQQPEGVASAPAPNMPRYVDVAPQEAVRRQGNEAYAERERRLTEEGRSRASRLLAQQQQSLENELGGNVAVAMGESAPGGDGRRVEITGTPGTAVAVR